MAAAGAGGLSGHPAVSIAVNAGGDLVHRGSGSLSVGVENPARPFDNEPPLTVAAISNRAVATSGTARRGWTIRGKRFGRVLDPRTGWPVDAVASVSVLAPDGATADAVATVVGVLGAEHGLAWVAGLECVGGVGCFVVEADGRQWRDETWAAVERPVSPSR
jgi:thiamine biosynthesis lipoprotein